MNIYIMKMIRPTMIIAAITIIAIHNIFDHDHLGPTCVDEVSITDALSAWL